MKAGVKSWEGGLEQNRRSGPLSFVRLTVLLSDPTIPPSLPFHKYSLLPPVHWVLIARALGWLHSGLGGIPVHWALIAQALCLLRRARRNRRKTVPLRLPHALLMGWVGSLRRKTLGEPLNRASAAGKGLQPLPCPLFPSRAPDCWGWPLKQTWRAY